MFGRTGSAPKQRTRKLRLVLSYAPDWVVTIGLAAAFFALDKIDGFRREFSLTDTTIQHTYTVRERVPNWMLMVICAGVPTVIMPIVNMLTVRSWWDWHNSMLGLILGLATTGAVTQVVKVTVGRPRPDAIARCKPSPDAHDNAIFGLVTTAICTETDAYMMKDGWRSFFSGHASLSFAGLGFLSFYLAGKLHLFDERGHTGKAWIALTPLTGALLTAISRTMDYRHHWQDVLVGSIVGLTFSYFSYRQYYPTLESPFSHKPYSPRIARDDTYRDSMLPLASGVPQEDYDYNHNRAERGPTDFRRTGSAYSIGGRTAYSVGGAAGYSSQTNAYPPPMPRMRSDNKYDDEERTVGMGASVGVGQGNNAVGGGVGETVPRPSAEPLVDTLARERHERT
ncbi:PAP2-domain-containing protein [Ceratobasidium sp. AG-I]|nr:PAP2-domain-containing protein [Ceratobasidium sp. AG-I]